MRHWIILLILSLSLCMNSQVIRIDSEYSISKLLHQKINQERKLKKADTLSWNSQLESASYIHSSEMAKHNFFAHMNSFEKKYETIEDRLKAVNYSWSFYAENCVFITLPIKHTLSNESIANRLNSMWIKSPGHYKNIVSSDYSESGIAIVKVKIDQRTLKYIAVQSFGRRN